MLRIPSAIAEDVVLACRALGAHGLSSGIGGHVSVREPGQDAFWINAFDRSFEELEPDDVVQLTLDGQQLEGSRPVSLGVSFHNDIYRSRPDIGAIVHTHGFWITAFSTFGRAPRMFHNLCTFFYDDFALSPDDDFESIAPALGRASTIVIPNHGAITVGPTLERAAALHLTLEFAAKLDVTLASTEQAKPLPDSACPEIRALVERANYLGQTWELMKRSGRRELARSAST